MTKNTEIKFTKDELDSLQQLRTNYANIELSLGKLEIARIQQEQQLENLSNEKLRLETQYSEIQSQEVTLVQELNDKYGAGNLDPETGVFTPVK
jgi:DNA repair exonuclease SbcCD ATPase subunit|tara:strand:+ start:125 stop:406 length:282 start_codon:yes stop_codon:yes gene_type:complete